MTRPSHEFAHGPPPPAAPGTPQRQLLGAATTGDLALLERMARKLDAGRGRLAEAVESVNYQGVGALHLAAGNGKADACEYLVEDVRVDVDAVDIDGHCEIVELLLSRGAYVDTFSTCCGTPLHVAALNKQDAAMKILLDHHADCNKILDSYRSPLLISIFSHSVECVNLLLEAGADVKGIRTATPLHAAARNGLTDILKALLDAGADPNVLDEFSHLPIQLAAYFGTRKDVEILFEVTSSRIPAVHDWSVDGIIRYVKSEPKVEDHPLSKLSVAKLIEEGDKAMQKEDYDAALEFYNVAMMVDPQNVDSTLISNRSFCQIQLGYGEGALIDAHVCRAMQPDRADACWLQGYSYVLLQDYEKACDAFLNGLKLEPGFDGIEKALREALRLLKEAHTDKKNGLEGQYREARIYL